MATLQDELRGWKAGENASDDTRRMIWLMEKSAGRLDALEKALGEIAGAQTIREPKRSNHNSDDAYWEACGVWRMALKARAALIHPNTDHQAQVSMK